MKCVSSKEYTTNLSSQEDKWLYRAIDEAAKSTCKNRHGAILVSGRTVLARGHNILKNEPNVFGEQQKRKYTTHAEVHTIHQVNPADPRLKRATLYIARILTNGELSLSRPCNDCYRVIRAYGICKVIYTLSD